MKLKKRLVVLFGVVLVFGLMLFLPVNSLEVPTVPSSITFTFDESLKEIALDIQNQPSEINEVCFPFVLHHVEPTEKAVLLFHGFTNCPAQMRMLAEQIHERGYNVYVPRIPQHGFEDRGSDALNNLFMEDIITFTSQSVDVTSGLGEKVYVAGLSLGGLMSASTAINNKVDTVMVIAPNFGYYKLQPLFTRPVARIISYIPNYYIWWDQENKDSLQGPQYAYYGFPINAMGKQFLYGQRILKSITNSAITAERVIIVSNNDDTAIQHVHIKEFAQKFKADSNVELIEYSFPSGIIPNHDIIDPNQVEANVETVYPKLLDLLFAQI